jgi:ELWxxDGT repeat protein
MQDDGVNGFEPWVSDGTPGGTYILGGYFTRKYGIWFNWFHRVNNRVFFPAMMEFTEKNFGRVMAHPLELLC